MTLLEVLVVISILALISLSLPTLTTSLGASARLRDAAYQLSDDLSTLQREAMATGAAASLEITNNGATYVLRPTAFGRELPEGAILTFLPMANQLARPTPPALSYQSSGPSFGGTFSLTANGDTRTVTVAWPTGLISHGE